jgi:hypothetical protein
MVAATKILPLVPRADCWIHWWYQYARQYQNRQDDCCQYTFRFQHIVMTIGDDSWHIPSAYQKTFTNLLARYFQFMLGIPSWARNEYTGSVSNSVVAVGVLNSKNNFGPWWGKYFTRFNCKGSVGLPRIVADAQSRAIINWTNFSYNSDFCNGEQCTHPGKLVPYRRLTGIAHKNS